MDLIRIRLLNSPLLAKRTDFFIYAQQAQNTAEFTIAANLCQPAMFQDSTSQPGRASSMWNALSRC